MSETKKSTYAYKYPRPAVTADCVIFGFDVRHADIKVLLIERGIDPFKGQKALPGGFARIESKTDKAGLVIEEKSESLMDCAKRELEEETGLVVNYIEEVGTFSAPGRDPRGVVFTDAYFALVNIQDVQGGDDAAHAEWYSLNEVLATIEKGQHLAFDHDEILKKAFQKLNESLHFRPIGFDLLPEVFSMTELQHLYESIIGRQFDRRNFARKMLDTGILEKVESEPRYVRKIRYRFKKEAYEDYKTHGRFKVEF